MTCGIYVLYYETDDFQYYIGQSINIENRYKAHCNKLKRGAHSNSQLQSLYRAYGQLPSQAILEEVPNMYTDLNREEIKWISNFDSYIHGMNATRGGGPTCILGENNPNAVYSNTEIIELVKYIANNPMEPLVDISAKLKISLSTVTGVAYGNSYVCIAKEIPKEYAIMLSIKGTRNTNTPHVIDVRSIYTDSKIEKVFALLLEGSSPSYISNKLLVPRSLVNGIFMGRNHKWLCSKFPSEYKNMLALHKKSSVQTNIYMVKSPDGQVYYVENQTKFAKEHRLSSTNLNSLLKGRCTQHLGWTLA